MSKREPVETPEYLAMLRRMIQAGGRRVVHGDEPDLADLVGLRAVLEDAIAEAVLGQRETHGRSWADVARGLGTTREAAFQRYGKLTLLHKSQPAQRAHSGRSAG